jgi:hypothetical protein
MNEDKATRLLVSRSLTRKIGENFEKLIFQAETTLPEALTLEEGFRDLNGTVVSALREAAESPSGAVAPTPSSPENSPAELFDKPVETITATDGKQLAKVFQQKNNLVVKIPSDQRLPFKSAPVQGFLIPRVLDAMWNKKNIDNYEFQRTADGFLTGIQIDLGGESGAEKRIKELTGAIAWTLKRLSEKRPGATRN